jgi:TolB-like protein/Tfp pilus assembly protein PilF
MPRNPDNLTRFWKELKRRRVVRVVATYAATSYIIIQVTNNLVGPLQLPEWTATLVILLLAAGLPITVILAWVFDITPEGIKKTEPVTTVTIKPPVSGPFKRVLRANNIIIAVLLVIAAVLAWPQIFKRNNPENLRSFNRTISVAVMPFQNMTNDKIWNDWQDGIQVNLITSLSNSEDLKIIQLESVNRMLKTRGLTNYASLTPSVASKISQKLNANVFVYGSIKQAGVTIRINAQLIDSKTEDAFRSFQIDGTREDILFLVDSLSVLVKNSLIISKLGSDVPLAFQHLATTNSSEAYRCFTFGNIALQKYDYSSAIKWFSQAFEVDSSLIFASILLSFAYANEGSYDEAKECIIGIYKKRDQMANPFKIWTNYVYAVSFETPNEEIRYLRQLKEIDDQLPGLYYYSAIAYNKLYQFDKAIPELEKTLEIYSKWKSKPFWIENYTALGLAYHKTSQQKKEKKLYRKAERYFPDDIHLTSRQAILALTENDTIAANGYIKKFRSISKDNLLSESDISGRIADIYCEADFQSKAENYYRQALSSEPGNPDRLNGLAWFLIDKNRNIAEGLQLTDKALESNPNNYLYLDCKGWGFYKQGKYSEALELIQKSWNLKPIYNYEIYLHLEAAKKTVAGQKNN